MPDRAGPERLPPEVAGHVNGKGEELALRGSFHFHAGPEETEQGEAQGASPVEHRLRLDGVVGRRVEQRVDGAGIDQPL